MTHPGNPFTAPLHGILPRHCPTLRYAYVYVYIYGYVYNPVHLCHRHDHRKHSNAAPIDRSPSHQLSGAILVIGISSFAGHSFRLDSTQDFRFDYA